MITFVFPGQGSQSKGMGGLVFDEFGELTAEADQILGYSVKKLCLEDPDIILSLTQYTQPALFIVNALSYLKRIRETGKKPDFVAGHSLGEYVALFAAGAFDFRTGLELVKKRGELMGRVTGGGMAAVLGLNKDRVEEVLAQNGLQSIDIANLNSPFQIVISGPVMEIGRAKDVFGAVPDVKMFVPLKTSGAFHSRHMAEVQKEFEIFIRDFQFSELTIPVISNVHGRPYPQTEIKQNLILQITQPVKWTESIRYLMGFGEMKFEEIGPGKVLTGLIGRIQKEAEPLVVDDNEKERILAIDVVPVPSMTAENHDMPESRNQKPEDISKNRSNRGAAATLGTVVSGVIKTVQEKAKDLIAAPEKAADTANKDSKTRVYPKPAPGLPKGDKPAGRIVAASLGNPEFKKDYNLKYAYLAGGMYRGIASREMVVRMAKAGLMAFFGTGGLEADDIEQAIRQIQSGLSEEEPYGMNLVYHPNNPETEEAIVNLFLKYQVRHVEAAAFLTITPALVRYRAKGLQPDRDGRITTTHKIIAKVSRPELAAAFLSPAPERILAKLLAEEKITPAEAELSGRVPVADDICAEADSGGHTDSGVAYVLLPVMRKLRDEMMAKYRYQKKVRVGAAGGIGTPEAAAAAFMLGADFILTGSINQCTVEAATSEIVKDLLQQINVQDTGYAPAKDMFEWGSKVQVLKRGLFFPARANKLYELYRQYDSLDEIDEQTRLQIQEKYFKRSFEEVFQEIRMNYSPQELERAGQNPKARMAMIFKWYFDYSTRLALSGNKESQVDYQVPCGPALGAFNQWVKGTELEDWKNRHVDTIAVELLNGTAAILNQRYHSLLGA